MRGLLIRVAVLTVLAAGQATAASLDNVRDGNTAFGEGRYEAAIDLFTRAILAGDLEPSALAITFNNRGVVYSELGDYDRAMQDYEQALSLRPGDSTATHNLRIAYSRRGMANAKLGNQRQALADFTKAIEIDPNHAPGYMRRGTLNLERGDDQAALADLQKARELDPSNPEVAEAVARIQSRLAGPPAPAVTEPGPIESPAVAMPEPEQTTSAAPSQPPSASSVDVAGLPARPYRTTQSVYYREGPGNAYAPLGTLAGDTVVDVIGQARAWFKIRLPSGVEGFVYERFLQPVVP